MTFTFKAFTVFIVGLACAPAYALQPFVCGMFGTQVSPQNPGPSDVIRFSFVAPLSHFYPNVSDIFTRVGMTGGKILLEIVLAESAAPIPGFVYVGKRQQLLSRDGSSPAIGPFVPGTYAVEVKGYVNSPTSPPTCNDNADNVVVQSASGPVTRTSLVEFYNAQRDHYFVTQDSSEIGDLDSGKHVGWMRTGESFAAYAPGKSDHRGQSSCRWYAPSANLDTHFFSASAYECDSLFKFGDAWMQETSDAFEVPLPDLITGACPKGTVPVYRLWNQRTDSNHRYTTRLTIRQQMIDSGFLPEGYGDLGVAMCSPM